MKTLLSIVSLILLSGCAQFNAGWHGRSARYPDAYANADLDELLSFGSDFANKTGSARAEECRAMRNRQKESPGVGIQLHLLTGRLLSDACGDTSRILDGVDSLGEKNLPDERVRQLVSVQTETLKRLGSRKPVVSERKQKAVQTPSASESKEPKESKKGETKLLRDKLEAIRSIERKLDETGDGN
ncbi:MAG: hypothetical protein PHE55_19395 [Methylococcaceae bacterium]|nr:hypothetical protein [Methylococcaceae bacterium]